MSPLSGLLFSLAYLHIVPSQLEQDAGRTCTRPRYFVRPDIVNCPFAQDNPVRSPIAQHAESYNQPGSLTSGLPLRPDSKRLRSS
jgi:hypothetical protein